MTGSRPAVHRTILVVDVEGFGDRRRTNAQQVTIRKGMYRALRTAFGDAGIPWDDCDRADCGDGIFVLAKPTVPKARFVEALPPKLVERLRDYNRTHASTERIRLRMAVHAGDVIYDDFGVTGEPISFTFRLLDAPPLKRALATSAGVLAVVSSWWFFEDVVRHEPEANPATYRPVRVAVKKTNTTGWICLPDHPYPADERVLRQRVADPSSWWIRRSLGTVVLTALLGLIVNVSVHSATRTITGWVRPWLSLAVSAAAMLTLAAVLVRHAIDRRVVRQTRILAADDTDLDHAARALGSAGLRRWTEEAAVRGLNRPQSLRVRWAPTTGPAADPADILREDHLRGRARLRRHGDLCDLPAAFRELPRRLLVVLGSAGAGKSTLAMLLTLGLLTDPRPGEPVPVQLRLASWQPQVKHLHVCWLGG